MQACAALNGLQINLDEAEQAVEKQQFEKFKDTGRLKFRRHGKSLKWKDSPNFNESTLEIATRLLGPMRARLGYPADDLDPIESEG